MKVGIQLTSVSYWTAQSPFLDRFKTSNVWSANNGKPLSTDRNGYPAEFPQGATSVSTHIALDAWETGQPKRYVLSYEGTANIRIIGGTVVSSKPGEIVFDYVLGGGHPAIVNMSNLSASDPVTSISVVRQDQLDLFKQGQMFNPEFLEKSSEWSTLRFMDWQATNRSGDVKWADRTTLESSNWGANSSASGVPIEAMVRLANESKTDMWFNVPTQADDEFVRNSLAYIRDNLDPSLGVKIEYSNEVWNWGFPQAKYSQQKANELWGKDVNGNGTIEGSNPAENVQGGWMQYYGYRSAQIGAMADSVFGNVPVSRMSMVLSTQTANTGLENYAFQGIAKAGAGSVSSLFDAYSITTYFGNALTSAGTNGADRAKVLSWARSGEAGMAAAFRELEFGGSLSTDDSLKAVIKTYAYQAAVADKYGLNLVAYEGGAHLTASFYPADVRKEVQDFIGKLMNDQRMSGLYTRMVKDFEEAGGTELMAFADVGTNGASGYWGILDSIYQDSSPRYDALRAAAEDGKTATTDSRNIVTSLTSFSLTGNMLTLTYGGAQTFNGVGNELANTLTGGAGNDTLLGYGGNDTLDGGKGADRLIGGDGNDIYMVDNVGDVVVEALNSGADEVRTTLASYTLGANVEKLTFTGTGNFYGLGNGLDNIIVGGDGGNWLDGAAGADRMVGGRGDDVYIVDSAGDLVVEEQNEGIDEVKMSLANYTLGANVENLTILNNTGASGTGNVLDNVITGRTGNDRLYGQAGNDTLIGNEGNDTLDGGIGSDQMIGGNGDDTYHVDNAGDRVVELANQGNDRVIAWISHALTANIETLTLSGTAAIDGTGNELGNVLQGNGANNILLGLDGNDTIFANAGDDVVDSGDGNDVLWGGAGNDRMSGGAGNDLLDGGAGDDVLSGGAGNDSYNLDSINDVVIELAGEGTDSVNASFNYSLGANVERLYLGGAATLGTGNELDNLLQYQGTAEATLHGLAGDDTLNGGARADKLYGGAGNDQLNSGAGDDLLVGGAGADRLAGGTGADRFVFERGDLGATRWATDTITDFSAIEGDKIDLSAIDANSLTAAKDGFRFIGGAAFSKRAGELRYQVSGNIYDVQADLNGDGVTDLYLVVGSKSGALSAGDFALG